MRAAVKVLKHSSQDRMITVCKTNPPEYARNNQDRVRRGFRIPAIRLHRVSKAPVLILVKFQHLHNLFPGPALKTELP